MDTTGHLLYAAHELYARANVSMNGTTNGTSTSTNPLTATRPPVYKAVGISLAVASGFFIGTSFVLKKIGLLRANVKYNEEAGEGYGYLKNAYWWTGMTLMIIGEFCNFAAYAFVDAILVTPLGALSVVITTVLSAIFLKERLSFVGKIGCFMCIIGSVVIVMNAPSESSAATIQQMQHFVIAPGFLTYAGVIIIACVFIAFYLGPRYGKKTMLVYLSICSLIGGLSVVATQGLGAAIVTQIGGTPQFNQWFLYVLLVFVICTLVTEILFLNKALNLFNAALVTPTYYVFFTSSTIVASAILFRGFKGTPTSIITVVMGFLQICAGVVLLQLSKSAKDVPDSQVFSGDLDQVRTVAEQEQPESEPQADAIRGTAAIIRRLSQTRAKREELEAIRVYEDKMKDQMEPIAENEQVEWDGLRRRKTILGAGDLHRRKTLHPPLGLTHFPDEDSNDDVEDQRPHTASSGGFQRGLMNSFRRKRPQTTIVPGQTKNLGSGTPTQSTHSAMSTETFPSYKADEDTMEMTNVHAREVDGSGDVRPLTTPSHGRPIVWAPGVDESATSPGGRSRVGLPPLPGTAKRQFSFSHVFKGNRSGSSSSNAPPTPVLRKSVGSRQASSSHGGIPGSVVHSATEEERLGLVKGDSSHTLPSQTDSSEEDEESIEDGSDDEMIYDRTGERKFRSVLKSPPIREKDVERNPTPAFTPSVMPSLPTPGTGVGTGQYGVRMVQPQGRNVISPPPPPKARRSPSDSDEEKQGRGPPGAFL
ncbi:MAG: hypothetical protein MMC33_003995 [Icmadophila ericetorum]|nr:hypothetical protein [Icmadophila ericetorum]